MSQVDYLHYFNDIILIYIQYITIYVFICVVYVQRFYKIFRFRLKIKSIFFTDTKFTNVNGSMAFNWLKNIKENFLGNTNTSRYYLINLLERKCF